MVKFDDELTVEDGVVIATGPFDPSKEEIVELCAWVFQRDDDDGNDFAATEMTDHHHPGHPLLRQGEGELTIVGEKKDHWQLPIARVGEGNMQPGKEAFAVAVALIKDKGKQRVIWWGHPVMLKSPVTA